MTSNKWKNATIERIDRCIQALEDMNDAQKEEICCFLASSASKIGISMEDAARAFKQLGESGVLTSDAKKTDFSC